MCIVASLQDRISVIEVISQPTRTHKVDLGAPIRLCFGGGVTPITDTEFQGAEDCAVRRLASREYLPHSHARCKASSENFLSLEQSKP